MCYNVNVMGTAEFKSIISESLNTDDIDLFQRMVEVIENYKNNKKPSVISRTQIKELDRRRSKHFTGEGSSFTWQEIKQELIDKHGL